VIAGGTGGLGLAIAKWMVEERGAKRLLLLSRSGEDNLDAARTIGKLRERGVSVEAPKCDITDASTLFRVLEKYSKSLPPIGGCIQASMVLRVCKDIMLYYSCFVNSF
jgi:NAD(P)-dependent dehydrogenase (short-subunit alcohol dehydrogenase family)